MLKHHISLQQCKRGGTLLSSNMYTLSTNMYGAYNMTKLFEFELCKFELLTSVI